MQTESISREVNRAWLAGILDGEGTMTTWFGAQYQFKHQRCQGRHLVTRAAIGNTDALLIQKISEVLVAEGIKFSYSLKHDKRSNRRPFLSITITGKGNARRLLESTLPYVAKKARSKAMLEVISHREALADEYGNHNEKRPHQYWRGPVMPEALLENDPELNRLIDALRVASQPVDPSETKRRAGTVLAW